MVSSVPFFLFWPPLPHFGMSLPLFGALLLLCSQGSVVEAGGAARQDFHLLPVVMDFIKLSTLHLPYVLLGALLWWLLAPQASLMPGVCQDCGHGICGKVAGMSGGSTQDHGTSVRFPPSTY